MKTNDRDEYIEYIRKQIAKYRIKCKKSHIEFLRIYYMGKLAIYKEIIRRMTGERIEIYDTYFIFNCSSKLENVLDKEVINKLKQIQVSGDKGYLWNFEAERILNIISSRKD